MKPTGDVFDSVWRAACAVEPVGRHEVALMIEEGHYLKKWPAIPTLILGLRCYDTLLGVIVFAQPPLETNTRYGGPTWELARLWCSRDLPKNAETFIIGRAVRYIKRTHPLVKFLVSYADPSVGHSGLIYRAANWKPDGSTDDGRNTPRFDYKCAVSGRSYSRRAHVPEGVEIVKVARVSKLRFYYAL